jgi:MFS superfamily sulfate permease-like transporter
MPVLKRFVFGLALTIMVGQVSSLIGVEKGKGDFSDKLWHLVARIPEANPWTAGVGGVALLFAFGVGSFLPRVPSALVVFVLGIWAVRQFGLGEHGVEMVG